MTDGEVKMEEDPPAAEVKKDDAPTAEADSKKRAAADDADDEKPLTAVKKPKVENTKLEDSDDDVPIGTVPPPPPAPRPRTPVTLAACYPAGLGSSLSPHSPPIRGPPPSS